MPKNIAHRPIEIRLDTRKDPNYNVWYVKPSLTVFREPKKKFTKNIIFVIDISGSMSSNNRLESVKVAIKNILDKLNDKDTFSAVTFSNEASVLINHCHATATNISTAKTAIESMSIQSNTNFFSAFTEINNKSLMEQPQDTTIIFLTDGANSTALEASTLVNLVTKNGQIPRIVPVGIALAVRDSGYNFLCELASLGNRGTPAIFINDGNQEVYNQAFQDAFNLAQERSTTPAQLEVMIEAQGPISITRVEQKIVLDNIAYDGQSVCGREFIFDSPVQPKVCEFRFTCDDVSLQGKHEFSTSEISKFTETPKSFLMSNFKWKDHRISRWLLSSAEIGSGLLLMAASVTLLMMFPLALMTLTTLAAMTLSALIGAGLFTHGVNGIVKKTCCLPTVEDYPRESPDQESYQRTIQALPPIQPQQAPPHVTDNTTWSQFKSLWERPVKPRLDARSQQHNAASRSAHPPSGGSSSLPYPAV
jgi:hypothetical protein